MIFSIIFDIVFKSLISLYPSIECLFFSGLGIRIIIPFFYSLGMTPVCQISLYTFNKKFVVILLRFVTNQYEMLSGPGLLLSHFLSEFSIPLSVIFVFKSICSLQFGFIIVLFVNFRLLCLFRL